MKVPQLAIVVPCHNEEEALPASVAALTKLLEQLTADELVAASSNILLVEDGSTDRTWQLIEELVRTHPHVGGLRLARNFGHQGAVLAGMLECDADAVITIDADLQDDERCMIQMLRRHREGCEIVLGVRDDRSSDSLFKRISAEMYYRMLGWVGVRVVFNHADYRLMSRKALAGLREYSETNLFLRGLIPLLGLRTGIVTYERRMRTAGESKYPLRKMLALAWEGVTSFSVTPLRVVAGLGALISLGSIAVTAWALLIKFFGEAAVPGWASTVVPMYFLGGVQILCLGVIGEYVGKIYLETKRRPRYAVDTHIRAASTRVLPAAGSGRPDAGVATGAQTAVSATD